LGRLLSPRRRSGSAAGSRETLVVYLKSLEVGSVTVSNLLASVIELAEIPGGSTIDGVIGHDALGSLRYTIDFRKRQGRVVTERRHGRPRQFSGAAGEWRPFPDCAASAAIAVATRAG
jgi:hypothetical protein